MDGDCLEVAMLSSLKLSLVLTLAAVALAGCGVRSSLQLPPEDKAQQAESGKPGPDGKAPHKPFILDGLLR